jgi:hypothetical protein
LPESDVLWHPALHHPSGHVGPAIIAVVTDALSAERINLHRTWLAADGSGKADIPKPRLFLKHHRKHGGVIRLFPDEELTTGLCVAEGLETALSAALGFRPVWATLDAGNLAAFPVLPGVECLTIVADHDLARPSRPAGRARGGRDLHRPLAGGRPRGPGLARRGRGRGPQRPRPEGRRVKRGASVRRELDRNAAVFRPDRHPPTFLRILRFIRRT